MSETLSPEKQHLNAVYDRAHIENDIMDMQEQLANLQDRYNNLDPAPARPDQEPTAVIDEPEEEAPAQPIVAAVPPRRPVAEQPVREERRRGRLGTALAIGAAALALVGGAYLLGKSNGDKVVHTTTERVEPAKDAGATTRVNPNAVANTSALHSANAARQYGNHDTGSDAHGLIGNFNINPSNPEQSVKNFESDLRHNPESLAFWKACLDTGNPTYDACTSPATLQQANQLAKKYAHMNATKKGVIAEGVIKQFEGMDFAGITMNDGSYQTVATTAEGTFFATTNSRNNDPWLNFVTKNADGKTVKISIRACAQYVKKAVTTSSRPAPTPTVTVSTTPHPSAQPTPAPRHHRVVTPPHNPPHTPPNNPPHQPPHQPPHNPPNNPPNNPPHNPPEVCPPGYVGTPPVCLHPEASGPPPEAVQAPRPQPTTPGYVPGRAENIDAGQHGPINNPDPTPHGTEIPGSQAGDVAPPIGDHGEVATPGANAPDNTQHVPGSETPGTTNNTSNPADSPAAQTPGTGSTSGPGTDTGAPN